MAIPITVPRFRAFTTAGAPLAAGQVFFYQPGTTTPQNTYSSGVYATPYSTFLLNTNPVILDANGEASIFPGTNPYRVILKTASGTTLWDQDNVSFNTLLPPAVANRNAIINGGLEVWQAGTTFTPAGSGVALFVADGWQGIVYTTGAIGDFSLSRVASGRPSSQFAMRCQRAPASVSDGSFEIGQAVETLDSYTMLGSYGYVAIAMFPAIGYVTFTTTAPIVLSFWMRFGANYAGGSIVCAINFAAVNAPNDQSAHALLVGPANELSVNIIAFPTDWTQYIIPLIDTGVIPLPWTPPGFQSSQVGISFISNNFTGTAGANDWFDIDDVQLEAFRPNNAPQFTPATAFEREPYSRALERCQRRYYKSFPQSVIPAQNAGTAGAFTRPQPVAAGVASVTNTLEQPWNMRNVAGTVTVFNPSVANAQIRDVTTGADCTLTTVVTSIGEAHVTYTSAGGSAAGNVNALHYVIDKRF